MKNIKKLSRNDLKIVKGGLACRTGDDYCPGTNTYCCNGLCRLITYVCP
ncbi:bacteriocin-like protein [Chryseobacterium paridis]|uniref:Bacteriocin n=1 Tax=Chryseobacterium paridis TaxID=2800328 RepID=A0ABS1FU85_9FLAO|nr:hypothetical protein [Chryseobacterium paridis]MBK1895964.1 hypothetical protein [Chryseobacterium paridis]